MIPLKIADQAIISCNKEIEKLQIENDRLKAEVERLTKAGDGVFQDFMEYVEYQEPAHMRFLQCQADWNAAKEGKQP